MELGSSKIKGILDESHKLMNVLSDEIAPKLREYVRERELIELEELDMVIEYYYIIRENLRIYLDYGTWK